ncbi:MAG: UspA domain-containing protein [Candidatus Bathyarchaeota archaeon B63]|nr:MAG: UspA domain-containing protein [Candidatus Bathyarchaeota archaeon B63]
MSESVENAVPIEVSSRRLSRILVPIDDSKPSMKALELAMDLAMKYKSRICIVNIIPTHQLYHWLIALRSTFSHETLFIPTSLIREMEEEARSLLISTLLSIRSIGIESYAIMGKGHPASEIVRIAKEENIDLIVIGSKKPSIFAGLLFGNISRSIISKAPCPVLVVKEEETHEGRNNK